MKFVSHRNITFIKELNHESINLIILKNVDQNTPGQTVPFFVLILLMVISIKEYVPVTTKPVIN